MPVSPVAIGEAVWGIQAELCAHLPFSRARSVARDVVREGLYGRLRESVGALDLPQGQMRILQARIARLWCETALALESPGRVRAWMLEHGYGPSEIELALRRG